MSVVAAEVGSWKPYRKFARGMGTAVDGAEEEIDRSVQRVSLPIRNDGWRGTSIGRHAMMLRNRWAFESAILARCRNPETRPDLIIWRYPLSLTSLRALRAIRGTDVPMIRVVTIFGGAGGRGWRKRIKKLMFPVPFQYLDCVVVSSDVMRENLRSLGVPAPIAVLPHGVDLERFHPHPAGPELAPIRERLGLGPQDHMILFVGPLIERKGADLLAKAWSAIAAAQPQAHLVLVGPEPGASGSERSARSTFAERLRGILDRGAGRDRVVFTGAVSNVEDYLRGADLFLFPSRREGMPNAVLEAFASGVPCLLSPFQGLSQDLGLPGEQYMLVNHDPSCLSEAATALLEDGQRRRALGSAALEWARAHLGLEESLDRLAGICYELAEAGAGGRPEFHASLGTGR